jgi:hypothetical protein
MASLVVNPHSPAGGLGLADPRLRGDYTDQHRGLQSGLFDDTARVPPSLMHACAYNDSGYGLCGHDRTCACHHRSPQEQRAGITDILAHDFQSPVITLHFAPGDRDWLTSPTPTPDAWYAGSGRP